MRTIHPILKKLTLPLTLAWTFAITAAPLPFSDEIAAFEARRLESPPSDGSILCIGSSSMRMWADRIEEDLAPLSLVKLGFGGSTFKDAITHFDSLVAPYNPRAILVYEGDNDINSGMTPFEVTRDFLSLATMVHEKDPAIRIYVISIKPSTARAKVLADSLKTNSILKSLCQHDPRFTYIDVMTPLLGPQGELIPDYYVEDGIHLNDTGYDIWARAIRNVIVPLERAHERVTRRAGARARPQLPNPAMQRGASDGPTITPLLWEPARQSESWREHRVTSTLPQTYKKGVPIISIRLFKFC